MPDDRIMDGFDLSQVLFSKGKGPRKSMFYYRGTRLYAMRMGEWKAHFITKPEYGKNIKDTYHDPPLLYNLQHDPSEKYNIAKHHPEILRDIKQKAESHKKTVKKVKDRLVGRIK
jgi:arylsulfatase A-like enzyme